MKGNDGLSQRGKWRGVGNWSYPGHILKVKWIVLPKGLVVIYG